LKLLINTSSVNLFHALQPQQTRLIIQLSRVGDAAVLRSIGRHLPRLLWAVTPMASAAIKLL